MATARILSIDGGGIRGLIPVDYIEKIEQSLDKPFLQNFHIAVGTSTAAFILFGLATRVGEDKPRYTVQHIKESYLKFGPKIFEYNKTQQLKGMFGYYATKYTPAGIDLTNREIYGDLKLSEIQDHIIITTQDITTERPFVFDTVKARENPQEHDYFVKDVIRAATAAPSFFPNHTVENESGEKKHLIDGGFFANNPTEFGFFESQTKHHKQHDRFVVSLGTGRDIEAIDPKKSAHWGLMNWLPRIWHTATYGKSFANVDLMTKLLDKNYVRINTDLYQTTEERFKSLLHSLDSATPKNMQSLLNVADRMYKAPQTQELSERIIHELRKPKATEQELKSYNEPAQDDAFEIQNGFNGDIFEYLLKTL